MLVRLIEFATNRTRWSTLKNLAKSRAAQLTVLAPFIGYLVVYNSELRTYLSLDLPESSNSSLVTWLKSHSLTFLYFGLVLYGAATAIFGISCPNKIRENKNIIEYVQKMEDVKTPNLVRRHLSHTVHLFLKHNLGERRSRFFGHLHPSFPDAAAAPLHLLIEELASSAFTDEEQIVPLQTGTGHWMTDEIMERMSAETRVERTLWMPLFSASFALSKEVFYVSYRVDDFRFFPIRVVILSLFVLGLACLVVPTIGTILVVLSSLF